MRFQKNNPVLVTRKEKYSTARTTKQKESQQTSETAAIYLLKRCFFWFSKSISERMGEKTRLKRLSNARRGEWRHKRTFQKFVKYYDWLTD